MNFIWYQFILEHKFQNSKNLSSLRLYMYTINTQTRYGRLDGQPDRRSKKKAIDRWEHCGLNGVAVESSAGDTRVETGLEKKERKEGGGTLNGSKRTRGPVNEIVLYQLEGTWRD